MLKCAFSIFLSNFIPLAKMKDGLQLHFFVCNNLETKLFWVEMVALHFSVFFLHFIFELLKSGLQSVEG